LLSISLLSSPDASTLRLTPDVFNPAANTLRAGEIDRAERQLELINEIVSLAGAAGSE